MFLKAGKEPLFHILSGSAAILIDLLLPKQRCPSSRGSAEAVKPRVQQSRAWPRLVGAVLTPPHSSLLPVRGAGRLWADE